jgi:hypothetical protein
MLANDEPYEFIPMKREGFWRKALPHWPLIFSARSFEEITPPLPAR